MNAVCWNPEVLIARGDDMQSCLSELIHEAKKRQGLRIQMDPSPIQHVLDRIGRGASSRAQFREGCVKAIELGMQPLPQKARVLAEIHRRIDNLGEAGSASCQLGLAAIVSFSGAWALAARLIREGLSVCIHEEGAIPESIGSIRQGRADVEVVIPNRPRT